MCECKFECCASYNGTAGAGSVIFGQCPFPDRKEKDCERHCIFTNMVADFQASGDKPAAALWKTRTTLNIPTAYDIGGEVRCPDCLGYFDTDVYDEGVLDKCPNCGAVIRQKEGDINK